MNGSVDDEKERKRNTELFRGVNQATIEARVRDIMQAKEALAKAHVATTYADTRMVRFLGEVLDLNPSWITIGSWACPDSPTKLCFYNSREDRNCDYCLICGEPDERL